MKEIKFCHVIIVSLIISLLQGCDNKESINHRSRTSFNSNWKFSQEANEKAHLIDVDDSQWRELDLPHDWAIEGPFTKEVSYKGGYLPYPGRGWYRKSFFVSSDTKNMSIEFDGIMRNSKVWLNGEYIGGWPYGYTSFALDITDKIKRGSKNLIAVSVENQDHSSRWYPGSGIYRNVWLTETDPVHVDHWGTFITTPKVTEKAATVMVKTKIKNTKDEDVNIELKTSIIDSEGLIIATNKSNNNKIPSKEEIELSHQLNIKNPKLWDIMSPEMYEAISEVYHDGRLIDTYHTPFGVRYFSFDPDKGFFLNGEHVKLQGVNLHHDLGPLGTAVNIRATQRQLEIMKEMGVNAIRTAHNPPSPEQLTLCDQMGIMVIDETFDEWSEAKNEVENSYNIWFNEWSGKDTRALIKRDRNHPSIIMWSIGNEIPNLDSEKAKKNAKRLSDICREMDSSRPVNAGIHLSTIFDDELKNYFDVFGMNYWQDRYDTIHKQFPNLPLLSTETSATLSSRGEYHFPVEEIYKGYNHPSKQISSYDLINTGFGAIPDVEFELQKSPWIAGQFVWSGFDYHGEPDPYEVGNYPAHSSYFGIVDMCGFKKDRFYLYQSQWSEKPMVHLLPHWNWNGREGEVTPVYIYSNCAVVELFVNGESKGKKEKTENTYRHKWEEITYQPGSIKAIGYDLSGNILCEKEIKTAGIPSNISLVPDRTEISANGDDLSFITVKITDKEGNLCPDASNLVRFDIEGEGTLLSVGNGDPTSLESYQKNERSAFHGLCLLIIKSSNNEGRIKISVSSENLESSSIEIIAKASNTNYLSNISN